MSAPLLASKLFVPLPPASLVARPQLLARLDGGVQSRLILLSAPPGFGKTTLLAQWIQQNHVPTAWISLDEGDNDPARLLSYLVAAFQSLEIDVSERVLASAQSPQAPSFHVPLTLLLNAASNHAQTSVIVLDDYHVICAPPVHQAITFLVEHMPLNLHLVLATRQDPPLPLARWRGRGHLVELRAADLRMTADQAATFLNQVMHLALQSDEIAKLQSRTEGWVAGLQMAALSLRAQPDVSAFVDSFSGSHRFIMDYLADEVLSRQPKPILDFLLSTCIVERLCASLCDALVDAPASRPAGDLQSSQAILEQLEAGNVFLSPLDHERRWFRYHHLFADIQRYRLKHDRPSSIAELHRRAAVWFEQNDLVAEAIHHHLQAGGFDAAAGLIEQAAPPLLWERGEATSTMNWLRALPDEFVAARPRLALLDGWLQLITVRLDQVERRLAQAEHALPQLAMLDRTPLASEISVMRAMVSNFRGDLARTIELSESALSHLPESNVLHRGMILGNLGGAHASCGQVLPAAHAFAEAAELGQQTDQMFLGLVSLAYLGEMEILQGHLHAAERAFRRALDWASEHGLNALPIAALANVGMGGLLLEWNRLEEAQHFVATGIASNEQQDKVLTGWGGMALLNGYLAAARISSIQGELDQAGEAIGKVRALAAKHMPESLSHIAAEQARLWLMQNDLGAAARWAEDAGLSANDSPTYAHEFEHLTLARVLIAQGRSVEAKTLLDRLGSASEADGRGGIVIQVMLLQALASHATGETESGLHLLENALSRAEPEGYVRLFVDEGGPMAELLRRMNRQQKGSEGVKSGGSPTGTKAYVHRLLDAFENTQGIHPSSPKATLSSFTPALRRTPNERSSFSGASVLEPSVESLSERELEVLNLVALGLSNHDIADRLTVTVPTVKKHLSNIFGKLRVANRTEAVARARETGML